MPKKKPRAATCRAAQANLDAFTPDPLKEQLLKYLAEKSLGFDGSADAFIMLLQMIREAMPKQTAAAYVDADNLLRHMQECFFNNSHYHADVFSNYRERLRARIANFLGEKFESGIGGGNGKPARQTCHRR